MRSPLDEKIKTIYIDLKQKSESDGKTLLL